MRGFAVIERCDNMTPRYAAQRRNWLYFFEIPTIFIISCLCHKWSLLAANAIRSTLICGYANRS